MGGTRRSIRRALGRLLPALGVVLLAPTPIAAETAPLARETPSVATLPTAGPHWVWVPDRLLEHSLLFDGDTGRVLGAVDSAQLLTPKAPLFAPSRNEIYSVDLAYDRGTRGRRIDFVTIYDAERLAVVGEIEIPTRVAESNTSQAYAALLDGERFLAVFNQFPTTSVSILDVEERRFAGEIVLTGCSGIYPVGPRRFASLCGDGSALAVSLDETGRKQQMARSPSFFDVVEDPIGIPGGRAGARWSFVSFEGWVHTVDFGATTPTAEPRWSLVSDAERDDGWRSGGLQYVALHEPTGRLYVVMHQGRPGSHKAPGPEIWVYDVAAHERVARFETPNLTAAFLAPLAGIAPDSFAERLLHWVVPSPGVHTIAVTQDDAPLLFARHGENGAVAVLDALTGEPLRFLTQAGFAGPTLRVHR